MSSEIDEKSASADAEHERYVAIWKVAVETQMHFNEMSVKSRQLGLTFVAAALGVAVVLFTRSEDFSISLPGDFGLHVSVLLIGGAALAIQLVRGLDVNVYHRMLRGAVTFGEDFEQNYLKKIFDLEKGMTQSISHFSRFSDANRVLKDDGKYHYTGNIKVTAEDKIKKFYRLLIIWLWAISVSLFLITNKDAIAAILSCGTVPT